MSENKSKITITPAEVLNVESPLVLIATLEPVAGLDRFQPAGFPEVGHVIYKAPRPGGREENVCILDSPASMANHLESVCMRGPHDPDLVDGLAGMPYMRCVTGNPQEGKLPQENREVVVTSLTEGHRIASTYFLGGQPLDKDGILQQPTAGSDQTSKKGKKKAQSGSQGHKFENTLIDKFGIALPGSSKAHPPTAKWWNVFKTLFRYDPNALVHGVMFPQWQIKIPRVLTTHLEAFGASRVDRSGVKFDRLGMTTSGQPIFTVDETTAREIRATFILDLGLVRSFGRQNGEATLGLNENQKQFLVALAFWKIDRLLGSAFRFRSGCHLRCIRLIKEGDGEVILQPDITTAITNAGFENPQVTDIYWPREELYREGKNDDDAAEKSDDEGTDDEDSETEE